MRDRLSRGKRYSDMSLAELLEAERDLTEPGRLVRCRVHGDATPQNHRERIAIERVVRSLGYEAGWAGVKDNA